MADPSYRKRLKPEVTCPICLDFFTNPVTLICGHNFCQTCLVNCWRESSGNGACPECRARVQERDLKQNWQLTNVAEIAKELWVEAKQRVARWTVCERHREPLKLFCKEDEAPICLVCKESKEHRAHTVVPVEEAALEYKVQISTSLKILRLESLKILANKAKTKKESEDLLEKTRAEKESTVAQFKELQQFLEDQEKLLLAQMEEVEKEIERRREEQMAKLSEEHSALESLIQEIEKACQQPAHELLLDIGSTLRRCKKEPFQDPVAFPLELKWRIVDIGDINLFLQGIMNEFKGTLLSGVRLQKANVTLDPDTAHPQLILAEDLKSVRWGVEDQDLPKNPERFSKYCCVLGCEGFTAGRHCWEVAVGSEGWWAVGVARKSVERKGDIDWSPEGGIWSMEMWEGGYWASSSLHDLLLSMTSGQLKKVRVTLNYAGGQVAFFDADTAALIYTFSGVSISGETLLPFFFVYANAPLTLHP